MRKFWGILLVVGLAAIVWWQWPKAQVDLTGSPQGQLPQTVEPLSYDIELSIDPDQDEFSGVTRIAIQIKDATDVIWLHGRGLDVAEASIQLADGKDHKINYQELGESGVVKLSLPEVVEPQSAYLDFRFQREFSDNLNGLYKVKDGELKYAFTQMESTYARQAFPSFDEPRFKVPFTVSINAPKHMSVIANTPEIKTSDLTDKHIRHEFATTKPLPTYLLAWAVGELDVVDYEPIAATAVRTEAIPLRGIATKGKGKDLSFALENTAKIVHALETYFQIPYPYEKLDILAVPDFEAGAMENAGAITYREQLLLLKADASPQQKASYFSVHAHELAHQWFGNLVTMPWWNDIWLNESFATWMENKISRQLVPELGFAINTQQDAQGAIGQDLLKTTRQIRQPIEFNHQISAAFDGITYAKGGAVLAMFEHFVGEEVFQRGVIAYLNQYRFGTATAEQFVAQIAMAANDERINSAFFSFLTQPGLPQLSVQTSCDNGTLRAELSQQRFLPYGSEANANVLWQFPVCASLYGGTDRITACTLLSEKEQSWDIPVASCPSAVNFNADGAGYYMVKQDLAGLQKAFSQLNQMPLSEAYVVSRSAGYSVGANHISRNEYLTLVPSMAAHHNREIITAPLGTMEFIADHVNDTERAALHHWMNGLYKPVLNRIGVEANDEETTEAKLLRRSLLGVLVDTTKDPELNDAFVKKGEQMLGFNGDKKVHEELVAADQRSLAMRAALNKHGKPYFDAIVDALDETTDGTLRNDMVSALSNADDLALAEEARGMVTGFSLRVNERFAILFGQLGRSPKHAEVVYEWFKGKYSLLKGMLPEGVSSRVPMIGMMFCTAEKRQDVADYFTPMMADLPQAQLALDNTLEAINLCIRSQEIQPTLQVPQ